MQGNGRRLGGSNKEETKSSKTKRKLWKLECPVNYKRADEKEGGNGNGGWELVAFSQ